jgi:hypothetical protein
MRAPAPAETPHPAAPHPTIPIPIIDFRFLIITHSSSISNHSSIDIRTTQERTSHPSSQYTAQQFYPPQPQVISSAPSKADGSADKTARAPVPA